jgi:DNA polymerase III delta prime subunit
MSVSFQKAKKTQKKLRLCLCGPSGSGKTFSALAVARGLGARIALVDTEHGSASLYADRWDYDVLALEPPYTPARYIEAIRAAESAGYDVLIIDSLSHAWVGEGGVLDMADKAKASEKNSFAAWRNVTPQHNKLVDAILGADLHLIVTLRTKTEYVIEEDDRGRKVPRKVGMAPVQRDGMEYEFDLVADLSVEKHVAKASKDRTSIFDGTAEVPSEEWGKRLSAWLTSGAPAPVQPKPAPTPDPEEEIKIAEKRHAAQRAASAKADAKPAQKPNGKPCCDIQTAVLELFHQASARGCALEYWKSTMGLFHYSHKDHSTHTVETHRSIAEWTDKCFGEPPADADLTNLPESFEASSTGVAS